MYNAKTWILEWSLFIKKYTMETLAPLLFLLPSALQMLANYLVDKFEVKYGNWVVFLSFFCFFILIFWIQQDSMQKNEAVEGAIQCGTGAAIMTLISIAMIALTIFAQILYLLFHWAFAKNNRV
jgi:hypothetical protein